MKTPRESFQVSGLAGEFAKIADTDALALACDYTLLQLMSEMRANKVPGEPIDPCVGLDANAQLHGARRALEILRTLHEPVQQPKPLKKDTLHYD